jgi:hypothetical protein
VHRREEVADVFISYSQARRDLTEALAADLEAQGYTVWWDTKLIAGKRFTEVINRELDAARAVIVIWTPDSIASDWVYSEAQHARSQGKLIPVRVPELEPLQIPKPFSALHTDLVGNRAAILKALRELKVVPENPSRKAATAPRPRPIAPAATCPRQPDRDKGGAGVQKQRILDKLNTAAVHTASVSLLSSFIVLFLAAYYNSYLYDRLFIFLVWSNLLLPWIASLILYILILMYDPISIYDDAFIKQNALNHFFYNVFYIVVCMSFSVALALLWFFAVNFELMVRSLYFFFSLSGICIVYCYSVAVYTLVRSQQLKRTTVRLD